MLLQDKWKYYNRAMIPTTAPHEEADLEPIMNGSIWKNSNKPLLARWTSDFDCAYETEWWYCIKDTPFNIEELKAKRRYEINRGNKYFECKIINPKEYKKELYEVEKAAISVYPSMYRPQLDYDSFVDSVEKWNDSIVYGAFYKETGKLCGYMYLTLNKNVINLSVQKANPEYERYQINAAMVSKLVEDFKEELSKGFYIVDGERNILHITQFQDYLEKYFGFRKAYCRLNVRYRPDIKMIVFILYPFRGLIKRFDRTNIVHNILGVLKMEEIQRKQNKQEKAGKNSEKYG